MSVFLDSRAIIAPLHIKYNDLCKFLTNRRHKKSRIPHTIKDARYLILFITEIPAGPQTEHTVLFCSFFSVLLFRSCCDLFLLYIAFFVKLAMAYFDYRKHGQFEWTGPAILFVCLIFVLLAPNYIWGIVGL